MTTVPSRDYVKVLSGLCTAAGMESITWSKRYSMALASADWLMSITLDQIAGSYRASDDSPSSTPHSARTGWNRSTLAR
jgi:hypothetical protein